jgi:hypothetical protein
MVKKCKNCGEIIDSEGIICPGCGQYLPEAAWAKKKPISIMTWIMIILATTAVILFFTNFDQLIKNSDNNIFNPPRQYPTSTPNPATDFWAFQFCKKFVSDRLKSPQTAEFQIISDAHINEYASKSFVVISYVDSENSFGANIRTRFTCSVKYIGNDKWQLEHLEFTD